MIKQENKRQEERRQSEIYFETKRKQDEWIRQEELRRRQDERNRQEEFRRRQEEIMREQYMLREEEFRRQEEFIREQYIIREEIMREQYMLREEEFRRRQEEMFLQEEIMREQEMILRENELRRRGLFMRRPYSGVIRPQIRRLIYPIAQMQNQIMQQPLYGRSQEFENRGVNTNDILNKFAITELKSINNLSQDCKNCTICLEDFKNNDKVIYLPCIHFFHEMCIKNWIKEHQLCPICKLAINNNNNSNNY